MSVRSVSLRRMGICEGGPHTWGRTGVGTVGQRRGWYPGRDNMVCVCLGYSTHMGENGCGNGGTIAWMVPRIIRYGVRVMGSHHTHGD